jgi:hypothetical protein
MMFEMYKNQDDAKLVFKILQYEQEIEDVCLKYLSEVAENPTSNLCKVLVEKINATLFNKNVLITQINATGNLGIALRSMLTNQFIKFKEFEILALYSSYYCLTKQINNPFFAQHPLLYINRSLLMFDYLVFFSSLKLNHKVTSYKISSSNEDVLMAVIMQDLSTYKSYNDYVHTKYLEIETRYLKIGNHIDLRISDKNCLEIHNELFYTTEDLVKSLLQAI